MYNIEMYMCNTPNNMCVHVSNACHFLKKIT